MADNELEDIKNSVKEVAEAAETIRGRQGYAAWAQLLMGIMTTAVGVMTAFNNVALDRVKGQQEALEKAVAARQVDENLSTTVLHETMLILDTPDEGVRKQKVAMHQQLLTTLIEERAGDCIEKSAIREFYIKVRHALPSALPHPDSDELASFDDQDAELGSCATQQAKPSEPAQAKKEPKTPADIASNDEAVLQAKTPPGWNPAEIAPNGEAVSHADIAQGWDIDVFWCVGKTPVGATNANEGLAVTLFRAVEKMHSAGDIRTIRLRRLPEVVNRMPAYNISPGAITMRWTKEKEEKGQRIQSWLTATLPAEEKYRIRQERANNTIPKYLPVYVCMEP